MAYEKRGEKEFYYLYDSDGNLASIRYIRNGSSTTYYAAVNSRGDTEALYNGSGNLVARYLYDSWGNMVSVQDETGNEITDAEHIGNVNPIRYRGYYYDVETGWYYLGSRYYDPEVGRFISADEVIAGVGGDVLGYNMFSYCKNNPVNMNDSGGNWPKWVQKVTNAVKKVVSTVANKVKKVVSKAKKTISKNCGVSVKVDKEKPTVKQYAGVVSFESGGGYNKSFNNNKSVNFYKIVPDNPMKIWKGGSGVDININGYGGSVQFGSEDSVSIDLPDYSFEWGCNTLGRNYFKYSYVDSSGVYAYNKFTVNGPELVAGALIYGARICIWSKLDSGRSISRSWSSGIPIKK